MTSTPIHSRSRRVAGLAAAIAVIGGCGGYPGPRSIANVDPAIKIPLMRRAVENRDRSAVPQLVEDLDSEDSAVRFYAIESLQRLTGTTRDYDWTVDDRHTRAPAIERWKAATSQPSGGR